MLRVTAVAGSGRSAEGGFGGSGALPGVAPAFFKAAMTSGWPNLAAQSKALSPLVSRKFTSAPAFNSVWMIAVDGFSVATAKISGVRPRMSRAFTSALAFSSALTISTGPNAAARCSGVSLTIAIGPLRTMLNEVLATLTLTPFSIRSLTVCAFLLLVARMIGVSPFWFIACGSAPLASRSRMMGTSPMVAAMPRAVSPRLSLTLTSAPLAIINSTTGAPP
jgi:hypothetical protein